MSATLFLVPTPLDFGVEPAPMDVALPGHTLAQASRITHWITENAKSTRAFLKRVDATHPLAAPLQAQTIVELPREVHKKGDHGPGGFDAKPLLAAALQGHDIGLVSEAGMPAIADPGASVVRAAHELGLRVAPLVGPVSLMLALAASGLNGQHFAFLGYLPQDAAERTARIRELESVSLKTGQTHLFIETPYRNEVLLKALLQGLHPHTRLAVMVNATLPLATVHSALVSQWKKSPPALPLDGPAVFLFGR